MNRINRNTGYGQSLCPVGDDGNRPAIRIIIACLLIFTLILTACGGKEKVKPANMEEIHREQGVPVRVQEIQPTEFIKEIDYTITVSGLKETRVFAKVSDQVTRIRYGLGQFVSQNQVVIDFPENNAQASYHQAQAAFNLAEQTWNRMQTLYETGGISKQDLDGAETQFKVAQANWDAVQQAVYVRAPITGMITDINVRELQKVNPGDYLFTISQLNKLHGRIWITENDINTIPKNAPVIFKWNDIQKNGKITSIGLSLNTDFNAFGADVEIDNADFAVRSGVTGKVGVVVYRNTKAIVVPRRVVSRDPDGQYYVYVGKDFTAKRQNVKISNESELNYEISEGLVAGDILIVEGLNLISDGVKVNVQ